MSIRIGLVDDQELVRAGFRLMLDTQPDMTVVGEAGDGLAAIELARRFTCDVMVMDARMPRLDGVEATRRIRAAGERPRVLNPRAAVARQRAGREHQISPPPRPVRPAASDHPFGSDTDRRTHDRHPRSERRFPRWPVWSPWVLADASVRERAAAVADKIEDLRVELTRSLRRGRPAAAPAKPTARPAAKPARARSAKALDDMTVQELRRLATRRHIAGRSSMNKAELVQALGKK
jgi:CheY-like chemotaxis protein